MNRYQRLKMGDLGHTWARERHALKRFKERYKRELSPRELMEIKTIIQNSKWVWWPNDYQIEYNGEVIKLIFHKRAQEIATFLPKNHAWGKKIS